MAETTRTERLPRRPNRWLLASEGPRAATEYALLQAARPWLASAPRGDGHQVLVLPGLGASDRSTVPLRRFLGGLGYDVHGWGLGRNVPSAELVARLRRRVASLIEQAPPGAATSLVGWSLGGIYAREIAKVTPTRIRQVVTLGSPFRSTPDHESSVAPLMRRVAASRGIDTRRQASHGDDAPLPVPSTSVFTRTDGIVPWRACVDAADGPHETLEVIGSHCGLGHHPAVLWVVADRLAQAPGTWAPMVVPSALRRMVRPRAGR